MAADAISLPARLASLPALLDFAHAFGREHALPPASLHRLLVILEELFLNTVKHGHGGGADLPVSVALALDGARLHCRYADQAPSFTPPTGLPDHVAGPLETRPVGGLGIALVHALASGFTHAGDANGHGNCTDFTLAIDDAIGQTAA